MNPPDSELGRTCTECGKWKPAAEMQSGEKYRKYRFSIRPTCLECNRKRSSDHYATLLGRAKKLIGNAMRRAAESGVPFEIDAAWFLNRYASIGEQCEATGVPLVIETGWGKGQPNPYSPSIDQTVAGRGYTNDNARIVCDAANAFFKNYGQSLCVPVAKGLVERSGYVVFPAGDAEPVAAHLRRLGYTVLAPSGRVAA